MKIVIHPVDKRGACGMCPFEVDHVRCALKLDESFRYKANGEYLKDSMNKMVRAHRPGPECPGPGVHELIKMEDLP